MKTTTLRQDMQQTVRDYLAAHFGCDRITISDAVTLESLGADQLDEIEIVIMFEIALDIEIPDGDTYHIKTVGQWVDYLLKRTTED